MKQKPKPTKVKDLFESPITAAEQQSAKPIKMEVSMQGVMIAETQTESHFLRCFWPGFGIVDFSLN